MALQKNSEGLWVNADGHYPVLVDRAHKHTDGLYRFRFVAHPLGAPETIESDTPYAYLPPGTFEIFVVNQWGRPLNDEEAERINSAEAERAEEPEEPEMSEEDKAALAELEAEEKAKTTPKGKR